MTRTALRGLVAVAMLLQPAVAAMLLALAASDTAVSQESFSLSYGKVNPAQAGRRFTRSDTAKSSVGNVRAIKSRRGKLKPVEGTVQTRKSGAVIIYDTLPPPSKNRPKLHGR